MNRHRMKAELASACYQALRQLERQTVKLDVANRCVDGTIEASQRLIRSKRRSQSTYREALLYAIHEAQQLWVLGGEWRNTK